MNWEHDSAFRRPTTRRRRFKVTFFASTRRAYFKTCREAIRAADPNHLILGCRFAGYAPDPVIEVMGEFSISFRSIITAPPARAQLRKLHERTAKPIALTEFAFKALDSGLPNSKAQVNLSRPSRTEPSISRVTSRPWLACRLSLDSTGSNTRDEPAEGRFDGENSNYGLVND